MRLLIVGPLEGYISAAGKIAMSRGATVAHVDDIERALAALRSGQGADLLMMDVKLDIARMIASLKQERISEAATRIAGGFGVPGTKYASELNGYYGGSARLPLLPLTAAEKTEIETLMRDIRN